MEGPCLEFIGIIFNAMSLILVQRVPHLPLNLAITWTHIFPHWLTCFEGSLSLCNQSTAVHMHVWRGMAKTAKTGKIIYTH